MNFEIFLQDLLNSQYLKAFCQKKVAKNLDFIIENSILKSGVEKYLLALNGAKETLA